MVGKSKSVLYRPVPDEMAKAVITGSVLLIAIGIGIGARIWVGWEAGRDNQARLNLNDRPTTFQPLPPGAQPAPPTSPTTPPDRAIMPEPKTIVDRVSAKYEPEIARARLRIPEDENLIAGQKEVVVAQTSQFRRAAEQQKLKELEQKLAEDQQTVERLMLEEKEEVNRQVRAEKEEAARREAEAARRKQQEALAAERRLHPRAVELTEALVKGLIKVSASGDGLESVRLSIESRSDESLEVTVPACTIFQANSGSTQSMVAREEKKVTLRTRGSDRSLTIDAACASMHKDMPGASDTFAIGESPASDDLRKLLSLPEFRRQSFRVKQFAIWTITDNPSRDGYVGIGQAVGFESGPNADELQTIEELFEKAGLSTQDYRALSPKPNLPSPADIPNFFGRTPGPALPPYQQVLRGANEVRIRNPNEFSVRAGLRSGAWGTDLNVPANGVASANVPDGRYDIYFVYSNKPTSLFQGDSFTLNGNGVEIRIVQVVNGNYGIRQVK